MNEMTTTPRFDAEDDRAAGLDGPELVLLTGVPEPPPALDASPAPGFGSLGVSEALQQRLRVLGITEPLPIQALAIADALAGHDVCGQADTGSGKTLAFGLPLLQQLGESLGAGGPESASARHPRPRRPGHPRGLVLVPTRELALQIADVLTSLAAGQRPKIVAVYGGVPIERNVKVFRQQLDLVIATPGRLIDLMERRVAFLDEVTLVVLDEADRMADMGFLPPVEKILAATNPKRQTMLFSATLGGEVDRLIRRHLSQPIRREVPGRRVTVDSMAHHFLSVRETERIDVVSAISAGSARTLVFVRTKHGADRLVKRLQRDGVVAGALHGGIRQPARERVLARFTDGSLPVLVATDVAARGLDVAGLDLVIHYDPPTDHTTYLHRSGRTARAGATGTVVSLVLNGQEREAEKLQRHLKLDLPISPVRPSDPGLSGLVGTPQAIQPPRGVASPTPTAQSRSRPGPARHRQTSAPHGQFAAGRPHRSDGPRQPAVGAPRQQRPGSRRSGGAPEQTSSRRGQGAPRERGRRFGR